MSYRSGKFWQPDVTVATVVARDGRFLMVEERVSGLNVYNQPAGHLEPDESLCAAAARETLEETAWQVEINAFIGAYQWKVPESGQHFLRLAFAAKALHHLPERTLDEGIVAAHWLSAEDIRALSSRHRSPLVWQTLQDYMNGQVHPLSAVQQL